MMCDAWEPRKSDRRHRMRPDQRLLDGRERRRLRLAEPVADEAPRVHDAAPGEERERDVGDLHGNPGGVRSNHGRAASSWAARRNSIASSPWRATSWTATGSPARERPSGSTIAGWPVMLNQTVKGEKAKTRRQYSSTSSIIMSSQPSLTGSVASPGGSSTS